VWLPLSCSRPSPEVKTNNPSTVQSINDLPRMKVTKLDGVPIDIRTLSGKIVLILFQPDCDHCQREAKEIREHIEAFKDYSLYFISSDQMPAIEKFGNDHGLLNYSNVHFASTTVESILNNLGPIPAPSVYIYSDQRLVQKFNGEIAIEKILQTI
jgi:peroxiredoxin